MDLLPETITTGRSWQPRSIPSDVADVDPLLAAVRESLPELSRWLPWAHQGYTRDDATRFVPRLCPGMAGKPRLRLRRDRA